jgi:outer membrane protein OmpA-like peptidoglycan-associated protein
MRKAFVSVTLSAFVAVTATACGAHKKMAAQYDALSNKVEAMGQSIEQTQERTRQNEAKINTVDQKAGAAQSAADSANNAAKAASSQASAANANADKANAAVDALGRKLVLNMTLSDAQGGFDFNKSALPASVMGKLDEVAAKMKSDPKGGFLDIIGYTDSRGTKDANEKVGLARANQVKRYLFEKHQIPLFRMNVISMGAENPVGDNKTKEGRAQNRRVELKLWM